MAIAWEKFVWQLITLWQLKLARIRKMKDTG